MLTKKEQEAVDNVAYVFNKLRNSTSIVSTPTQRDEMAAELTAAWARLASAAILAGRKTLKEEMPF